MQTYLFLVALDAAILLSVFYAVSAVYFGTFTELARLESGMLSAYVNLPLYLTVAMYSGTYSRSGLTDWQLSAMKAIVALFVSAALLSLFAFFIKINAELSRLVFVLAMMISATIMVAARVMMAKAIVRHWGPSAINRLVILAGGPEFKLPHSYHVDAEVHGLIPDFNDPQALDRLSKYLRNMDEVIVSCQEGDRPAWSQVLKGTGIHGEVTHQLSREIGAIGVVHHDDVGVSALKVSARQLGLRARATKRIFDLAVAGGALLFLSPIMLITALLIKLEDGGPLFFVQRRMGRGNEFFDILKFRSMRGSDANGERSATLDDDRITRIGRFIRRTSIDELPQLINVLIGDMSMVGPRPHALGSKAGSKLFWQVDHKYWQRHGLRPGITGLAQIRGHRGATDTEDHLTDRLLADLEYVEGWRLWRDIGILISTLRVLTHNRAF
ncbi:exopolysaccharide biosynthesis polyprenyl glycosylphosphotransferase [Aurantiacibacter marinus]|uniref:exopolysaccharide biosynthesis polyprenyl glycosylphosphotransferase n=1 Tax=Aurantiacibacter marinus TaxID=874156 RepID=UPI000AA9762E|nr:exopolysaccharide biosynthesis polyprenyl glycosylphosphotransferase [Aurantiacibacter marinus]